MAINVNTLSEEIYNNKRYDMIKLLEESGEVRFTLYDDGAGKPSIGIGMNLTQDNVLKAVVNLC